MLMVVEMTFLSSKFQNFFFLGTRPRKGLFSGHSHLLHNFTLTLPNTLLMKNVIKTPDLQLLRRVYKGHLQCGQTGKSSECVFINVSDPVEG